MTHETHSESTDFPAGDDPIRALLPGGVMGILTAEETDQLAAALQTRPELAAELAEYQKLFDAILVSTEPVQPPAGALDVLLKAASQPPDSRLQQFWRALVSPRWTFSPALVAAALLVFFGALGYLGAQLQTAQAQQAQLAARLNDQTTALAVMRSADVHWWKMPDENEAMPSEAFAWLIYSPGERSGVILASSFPQLSEDVDYSLWVSRGEEHYRLGLFKVNEQGEGGYVFQLPDALANFERIGITAVASDGGERPENAPNIRLDIERLNF
jgi:hypothetical protein